MSEKNECIRNGKVVRGNDFANRKEVVEIFRGKEFEDRFMGRGDWFLMKGEKKVVVFLKGEVDAKGWSDYLEYGERMDERGWKEVVAFKSVQGSDENKSGEFLNQMLDVVGKNDDYEFYVFLKLERLGAKWCKFAGVFKLNAEKSNLLDGTFFERKSDMGIL